jgi:hypothetical protein
MTPMELTRLSAGTGVSLNESVPVGAGLALGKAVILGIGVGVGPDVGIVCATAKRASGSLKSKAPKIKAQTIHTCFMASASGRGYHRIAERQSDCSPASIPPGKPPAAA